MNEVEEIAPVISSEKIEKPETADVKEHIVASETSNISSLVEHFNRITSQQAVRFPEARQPEKRPLKVDLNAEISEMDKLRKDVEELNIQFVGESPSIEEVKKAA